MGRLNTAVVTLARSVARGGGLGLLLAGLFLLGWSTFSSERVDCSLLGPQECAVAREVARAYRPREQWMGAALILLGGGMLVALQISFRADSTERPGA